MSRIALTLLGSLSLHGLVLWATPAITRATYQAPEPNVAELDWMVLEPELPTEPIPEPEPPETEELPEPEPRPEPFESRSAEPAPEQSDPEPSARSPEQAVLEAPSTNPGPAGEGSAAPSTLSIFGGTGESAPSETRPAPTIDLSPRAVAAATAGPRVITRQDEMNAIERRLNGELYAAANGSNYLSERPPPRLVPGAGGTRQFRGQGFSAVITAEGEVAFSDTGSVQYGAYGGRSPGDERSLLERVLTPLSFGFDISDAVERRLGNDPYAAERRWFLESTRELRHRLIAETRRRERGRALVRMRRDLQRLWSRSPDAVGRATLFRRWDGMSEDEIGAEARAAIVDFIRAQLPQGSEHGYTSEEIARFNGERRSRERFVPYE